MLLFDVGVLMLLFDVGVLMLLFDVGVLMLLFDFGVLMLMLCCRMRPPDVDCCRCALVLGRRRRTT